MFVPAIKSGNKRSPSFMIGKSFYTSFAVAIGLMVVDVLFNGGHYTKDTIDLFASAIYGLNPRLDAALARI